MMNDRIANLTGSRSMAKTFLANVYMWMAAALALTGLTAWGFATTPELLDIIFKPNEEGGMTYTWVGWVALLLPLVFIVIMGTARDRMSAVSMGFWFILLSLVMGTTLSSIFLQYSDTAIYQAFFTASITFVIMSLVGYATKTDLTKLGGILFMALLGLIVAMVVNMFLGSSTLDLIISMVGVLIFVGLIAYDTQKLKRIGASGQGDGKAAIWGALDLYLDFLNLFLFLLRLFNGGDD